MNDETTLVPVLDLPAKKLVAALDVVATGVPDLQSPRPVTARRVRGARTVSREAVTSTIAMLEASPRLRAVGLLDPEAAHELLQSHDALRLVAEHVGILLVKLNYTVEAQWAQLAGDAVQTYSVANLMSDDPKNAELVPHVDKVRRHLGRKNGSTGKKRR